MRSLLGQVTPPLMGAIAPQAIAMTSDQLFWRLVLALPTVDQAVLAWWLCAVRADQTAHVEQPGAYLRLFALTRDRIRRSRQALEACDLVRSKVLVGRSAKLSIDFDRLQFLLGHIATAAIQWPPSVFDPSALSNAADAKTACRLSMLLAHREQAIVMFWLMSVASAKAISLSTRGLTDALGGLVDRRTAMRAVARLQDAGLVKVKALGRSGSEYRVVWPAVDALLATFPFHEDARATMPGWADLKFPLLDQLSEAMGAAPDASVTTLTDTEKRDMPRAEVAGSFEPSAATGALESKVVSMEVRDGCY
jgi:hypothetical protein